MKKIDRQTVNRKEIRRKKDSSEKGIEWNSQTEQIKTIKKYLYKQEANEWWVRVLERAPNKQPWHTYDDQENVKFFKCVLPAVFDSFP